MTYANDRDEMLVEATTTVRAACSLCAGDGCQSCGFTGSADPEVEAMLDAQSFTPLPHLGAEAGIDRAMIATLAAEVHFLLDGIRSMAEHVHQAYHDGLAEPLESTDCRRGVCGEAAYLRELDGPRWRS